MVEASVKDGPVANKVSEGKAAEVEALVAPALTDLGYDIVRILLSGQQRVKLQVMIEHLDGATVTVDDCTTVSRAVSAILDVADPIAGAYVLEVSSPGLDRPLTRLRDFERFSGFEARIEMRSPLDGRRRFHGRLLGLDGDLVRLELDDQEIALPFADMAKAKLVMTDDLVASQAS